VQQIKPKLGNAAALFTDSQTSKASAVGARKILSKDMIGLATGISALLCLMVSIFLFQSNPSSVKTITTSESEAIEADNVVAITAKNSSVELVGTLVRPEPEHNDEIVHSSKPTVLSEQERKKLLQIISSD
jgi:hypothetical protein